MAITIISSLYNIALLLLLTLGSPWWLLRYAMSERFRAGLGQRFFGPSKSFATALPDAPRIWIHAVSVGEVLAITGLVDEVAKRAPEYSIVISTTTRTGQALARERFGAERCFYFPLDFSWSVAATLRHFRPSILVLAESELWPNVLTACRRKSIPVIIVNARVSDRSLPRYMKLGTLWRPFLQLLTRVLAQTPEDANRFRKIGVPADRISVGGNLKFDIRAPQTTPIVSLFKQWAPADARILVCGSTLDGEESLLLEAWPQLLASVPDAIMVLAPRHPERFDKVAALLEQSSFAWTRRSQWFLNPTPLQSCSIFLLDSIGELASLYSLATAAFIGGSLIPAGGHNPLEPAQFAIPIAIGPNYENFRSIVDLLSAEYGIVILKPQKRLSELTELLTNERERRSLGNNARRVFEEQSGATARAADAILELLKSGGDA